MFNGDLPKVEGSSSPTEDNVCPRTISPRIKRQFPNFHGHQVATTEESSTSLFLQLSSDREFDAPNANEDSGSSSSPEGERETSKRSQAKIHRKFTFNGLQPDVNPTQNFSEGEGKDIDVSSDVENINTAGEKKGSTRRADPAKTRHRKFTLNGFQPFPIPQQKDKPIGNHKKSSSPGTLFKNSSADSASKPTKDRIEGMSGRERSKSTGVLPTDQEVLSGRERSNTSAREPKKLVIEPDMLKKAEKIIGGLSSHSERKEVSSERTSPEKEQKNVKTSPRSSESPSRSSRSGERKLKRGRGGLLQRVKKIQETQGQKIEIGHSNAPFVIAAIEKEKLSAKVVGLLEEIVNTEKTYAKQLWLLIQAKESLEKKDEKAFFSFLKRNQRKEAHEVLNKIFTHATELYKFSSVFIKIAKLMISSDLDISCMKVAALLAGSNYSAYNGVGVDYQAFNDFLKELPAEKRNLFKEKLDELVNPEEESETSAKLNEFAEVEAERKGVVDERSKVEEKKQGRIQFPSLVIPMIQRLPRYKVFTEMLLKDAILNTKQDTLMVIPLVTKDLIAKAKEGSSEYDFYYDVSKKVFLQSSIDAQDEEGEEVKQEKVSTEELMTCLNAAKKVEIAVRSVDEENTENDLKMPAVSHAKGEVGPEKGEEASKEVESESCRIIKSDRFMTLEILISALLRLEKCPKKTKCFNEILEAIKSSSGFSA